MIEKIQDIMRKTIINMIEEEIQFSSWILDGIIILSLIILVVIGLGISR